MPNSLHCSWPVFSSKPYPYPPSKYIDNESSSYYAFFYLNLHSQLDVVDHPSPTPPYILISYLVITLYTIYLLLLRCPILLSTFISLITLTASDSFVRFSLIFSELIQLLHFSLCVGFLFYLINSIYISIFISVIIGKKKMISEEFDFFSNLISRR